jgi:hypothetical protein
MAIGTTSSKSGTGVLPVGLLRLGCSFINPHAKTSAIGFTVKITREYVATHRLAFTHPRYAHIFHWDPKRQLVRFKNDTGDMVEGASYGANEVATYLSRGDWKLVYSKCEAYRSDLDKWLRP